MWCWVTDQNIFCGLYTFVITSIRCSTTLPPFHWNTAYPSMTCDADISLYTVDNVIHVQQVHCDCTLSILQRSESQCSPQPPKCGSQIRCRITRWNSSLWWPGRCGHISTAVHGTTGYDTMLILPPTPTPHPQKKYCVRKATYS